VIPSEILLDVPLENMDRDPTSEERSIVERIPVFPAIATTAFVLCTTASANGSKCNSSNPERNPPSSDGTLPFTGVALQRASRGPR
jgi:hypothetical protein